MHFWLPHSLTALRCVRRFFETFSYLPPLSDEAISKQVDYIVNNSYIPSLEFAMPESAYTASDSTMRFGNVASNYYDNRCVPAPPCPVSGACFPADLIPFRQSLIETTNSS